MKNTQELAGELYEKYCASVGGKAFNGDPLPDWETFRADPAKKLQSEAWIAVAEQSRIEVNEEIGKARQASLELCWQIEKLPASEIQTATSIMASNLSTQLNELLP